MQYFYINDKKVFCNQAFSIIDLVKMIGGESASFTHLPPRLGEARDTQADITKIKTMMGWEPQVKLEDWLKGV